MGHNANLIKVLAAIFVLAVPAVSLSVLSNFSDAPYLQPLDLTEERIAAAGGGGGGTAEEAGLASIDVRVAWGRDWSGTLTRSRLREVISTTLDPQTKYYSFEFDDVPGTRVDVTFIVGANSYGPFAPGRMIKGLKSALIALRMKNRREG